MDLDFHRHPVGILFQSVLNRGRAALLPELLSLDWQDHGGFLGLSAKMDAWGPFLRSFKIAFPDGYYTIEDLVIQGDRAVARTVFRGTHCGFYKGRGPTGRWVEIEGIHIFRMSKGKIAEHWAQENLLSALQALEEPARPRYPVAAIAGARAPRIW